MPIRTCVGCRVADEQSVLVRLVQGRTGVVVSRTAPGRGAWLHPGCGELAARRRAVPRALKVAPGALLGLAEALAEVDAAGSAWEKPGPTQ
ncbi:YlxR family protein [Propioniciclava flava]|uniref:YlxR family protein n=1 Tax=Propioniciclava flava TaxID=2072026 RepID=UPI001F4FC6DB|nr:DUF448 domain-containing protein [Propioniciclava flava]